MTNSRLIDRRDFVKAAGAAFVSALLPRPLLALERADAVFASAYQAPDGMHGVAVLAADRRIVFTCPLPGRGHDVVPHHRSGKCVVFARRPGTFAVAFDRNQLSAPKTFSTPAGRHFYGHGTFSVDGRILYATENDFDSARGVIGVYDASADFARLGELDSHGVGPHEIMLMPDGRTLAIANGGIETHPDFGRTKLNLGMMEPSIAFIDADNGTLIEKHVLPAELSRLSVRHFDVEANGRLWFGGQYQGTASRSVPLAGHVAIGETPTWLDLPDGIKSRMRFYVGSVAINHKTGLLGLTSPEGGLVLRISTANPGRIEVTESEQACGIAPASDDFMVMAMKPDASNGGLKWDNHLRRL